MRTDTERLDWLVWTGARVATDREGDYAWIEWQYGRDFESEGTDTQETKYNTSREAIDAAMDEEE